MNEQSMDAMSTDATNRVACNEEATNERAIEWRPVVGYEGLYEVSNTGLVYSLYSNKVLKACPDTDGYLGLNLYSRTSDNKLVRRPCKVHRLVATAFIPNPENKPQIDHINGIKTDNRVENLRWASCRENINNPITLEQRNKSIEKYWEDPMNRARRAEFNRSPEYLERLHTAQSTPEYHEKMDRARDWQKVGVVWQPSGTYFESLRVASRQTGISFGVVQRSYQKAKKGMYAIIERGPGKGTYFDIFNQDNNQNPS